MINFRILNSVLCIYFLILMGIFLGSYVQYDAFSKLPNTASYINGLKYSNLVFAILSFLSACLFLYFAFKTWKYEWIYGLFFLFASLILLSINSYIFSRAGSLFKQPSNLSSQIHLLAIFNIIFAILTVILIVFTILSYIQSSKVSPQTNIPSMIEFAEIKKISETPKMSSTITQEGVYPILPLYRAR